MPLTAAVVYFYAIRHDTSFVSRVEALCQRIAGFSLLSYVTGSLTWTVPPNLHYYVCTHVLAPSIQVFSLSLRQSAKLLTPAAVYKLLQAIKFIGLLFVCMLHRTIKSSC